MKTVKAFVEFDKQTLSFTISTWSDDIYIFNDMKSAPLRYASDMARVEDWGY